MKLLNMYDTNLTIQYKLYTVCDKHEKKNIDGDIKFFSLLLHKKLHYYNFFLFKKYYTFSNGQLLKVRTKLTKFFKKSRKSHGASIVALTKKTHKKLSNINFFFCKNFNYKNYLWFKKFIDLINPKIGYLMITQGWNYVHKYKRRIKKKILRNLIKSSFIV